MTQADASRVMHELAQPDDGGHGCFEGVDPAAHEDPVIRAPADDRRMGAEADDEESFDGSALVAVLHPLAAHGQRDRGGDVRGRESGLTGRPPAGAVSEGSLLFSALAGLAAAVGVSSVWASSGSAQAGGHGRGPLPMVTGPVGPVKLTDEGHPWISAMYTFSWTGSESDPRPVTLTVTAATPSGTMPAVKITPGNSCVPLVPADQPFAAFESIVHPVTPPAPGMRAMRAGVVEPGASCSDAIARPCALSVMRQIVPLPGMTHAAPLGNPSARRDSEGFTPFAAIGECVMLNASQGNRASEAALGQRKMPRSAA